MVLTITPWRIRCSRVFLLRAGLKLSFFEFRLRMTTGGLCHAEGLLWLTESRLRMTTGGLRHAVATLQRGEGGEGGIRTLGAR